MSRAAFVTVPGFLCLADGTAGQHLTCLTGMPPAHAAYTARIVPVVVRASAVAGAITIVTAVVTVNTWNLYSASLATADAADRHASRPAVTVVIGAAGPLLSAIGIIGRFVPFLTVLGAAVPRLRAS
jgi:cytosine permease